MPNPIKYSTGSESDALKKGNLYIGTGSVGKGPSDTTGYYQGPSVPSGGYVIYMNKVGAPGGLSYHSAANDAELISFTNSLAGQSYTTAQQCFDYYYGQNDKVLVNQDYPADYPYIVMDGLVLNLDAGITQSYPGSGTVWTDVNGLGPKNNGTLTNGPTYNSANGGSIVFDGNNDYVTTNYFTLNSLFSIGFYMYINDLYNYGDPVGATNTSNADRGLTFVTYADGHMSFNLGNAINLWSNGVQAPNGTFSEGVWYYVLGTVNGTNMKLYVNGILINENTNGNNNGSFINYRINIGMRNQFQYPFRGSVSNLQIYNRALSQTEITQNYNATKGRFGL